MVSYRDPQVRRTYEAYEALPAVIGEMEVGAELLDQLVIGAYGSCVPHLGPAARGAAARNDYLCGITPAFRRQRLAELLATTAEDLRGFAPLFAALAENRIRTSLGSAARIDQDRDLFEQRTEL